MSAEALWYWFEGFAFSAAIRESQWLFPVIEVIHVLALAVTVGTIAFLDFRLLGLAARDRPAGHVAREVLPWTWGAFGVTFLSGLAMFASAASYYVIIPAFRYKVLCLALAGLNMLVLHLGAWRSVTSWQTFADTPGSARAAAALSLAFWSAAVIFGRWTGFF